MYRHLKDGRQCQLRACLLRQGSYIGEPQPPREFGPERRKSPENEVFFSPRDCLITNLTRSPMSKSVVQGFDMIKRK